jgi:hypothetical protein
LECHRNLQEVSFTDQLASNWTDFETHKFGVLHPHQLRESRDPRRSGSPLIPEATNADIHPELDLVDNSPENGTEMVSAEDPVGAGGASSHGDGGDAVGRRDEGGAGREPRWSVSFPHGSLGR